VLLAKIREYGSCKELEAEMFRGISSHWGVHHVPQVLSQDSKWFERSIDRKFGADLWVVFWVVPGDPDTCGQVTRRGGLIRTLVAG
jgi:phage gp29-like protein